MASDARRASRNEAGKTRLCSSAPRVEGRVSRKRALSLAKRLSLCNRLVW